MLGLSGAAELGADEVADVLDLDDTFAEWLADLARIGRLSQPALPPEGAERLLRQLGVHPEDLPAILAGLPPPEPRSPREQAIQWLVLRAANRLVSDLGDPNAMRRMPQLPEHLGPFARLFWIYVLMLAFEPARRWHAARGLPDAITRDTFADFGRHVWLYRRRTGQTGLDTHWWLSLHARGVIYALGRLQFQPFHLKTGPAGPLFWYEPPALASLPPGLQPGAPVLGVHIPESGSLTPAACDAAFTRAATFFPRYLPQFASSVAVCTSWLLDQQLADYLPADSNIVRFQRRFTLVPGIREADASPLQFIFGTTPAEARARSPRTTLERALLGHLDRGGHWYLRTGWLNLPP